MILHGDSRKVLTDMIDRGETVHSIVTDPPYGLTSVVKRFGKDGSAPARSNGATGVYKRASAGFMGQCYHPMTDVMTNAGWRRVGDVKEGDSVATLDMHTRSLMWQRVEQVHKHPFSGQMVDVSHRSARQVVTPNHRTVISTDGGTTLHFVQAGTLPRVFHLFAQAEPQRGTLSDVTLTTTREYGKDRVPKTETKTFPAAPFFRLFGQWLGDGSVCSRKNDHPANDFISICARKPRKIGAFRDTLHALGVKFTESPGARITTFYVYDFVLLEFLRALGGAAEKHIPGWLFQYDGVLLDQTFLGLMETDGCEQHDGQQVFHTVSNQLADDFQRLCLLTGRSAAKNKRAARETVINGRQTCSQGAYTLCILQPGKRMYGERSDTSSNVVRMMDYEGPVHCIGVAQHHTLYTRFDGKPVWSGNSWDGTGIEQDVEFWRLCWSVLKPGGYLLSFGGTRTWHRIACAIEDAGFEVRDCIMWLYGTGFPKSHDVSKGIDKTLGVTGSFGGPKSDAHAGWIDRGKMRGDDNEKGWQRPWMDDPEAVDRAAREYLPGSEEAQRYKGWGTALKPAWEPIIVARKPLEGTVAANVLAHGTGAMNIDGCRVPGASENARTAKGGYLGLMGGDRPNKPYTGTEGRWPANVIGSDDLPQDFWRFFYTTKASKRDRNTDWQGREIATPNAHPTVKPTDLMRWLVRLVTPPGGTVLDPFCGSGSTGKAARIEGFEFIGIEGEAKFVEIARQRCGETGKPLDRLAEAISRMTESLHG